jgi:hypothetical protein
MDGLESAAHGQGLAQFLQGQIGFAGQQFPQLLLVALDQRRLAAGVTVAGPDVAGMTALLQEFLDQAKGNPEAPGDFLAGAFFLVASGQDAFAPIQGNSLSQAQTIAPPQTNGYSFI